MHKQIDVNRLVMWAAADCIAGQLKLTGKNPDTEEELGFTPLTTIYSSFTRGFYLPYGFELENTEDSWGRLKNLWIAEIAKRN